MVERRTKFGIFYQSKVHPEEKSYPLSYHFVDDGRETRVRSDWEGKWKKHNRSGWRVGSDVVELTSSVIDNDLVVFDGDSYVTQIHPTRIVPLKSVGSVFKRK